MKALLVNIRYWYRRARLAGAFSMLPMALLVQGLGCGGNCLARGQITPASVSVSGYYRADGTYIHGYSRRPPGSRSHDEPYEMLAMMTGLISVGGFVGVCLLGYRLFGLSDWELIPKIEYTSRLPEPGRSVPIPKNRVVSRKGWLCRRCQQWKAAGAVYWFARDKYWRYCDHCYSQLPRDMELENKKSEIYREALKREKEEQDRLLNDHYKRILGRAPTTIDYRALVVKRGG